MLALALLVACSDYNLDQGKDAPGKPTPTDSGGHPVDTSGSRDTQGGEDSGGVVQPAPDGRIDVVLLEDVAYFYDCYHADLADHTTALVAALLGSGGDVAVALASFDDYQVSGEWWAADGGVPYTLLQQLTTDESKLDAAAATLSLEWGGDGPGTGYEAIFQATRGRGYDQDCDGTYDKTTDAKPYSAESVDAFGGKVTGVEDSSVPGTGDLAGVGFRHDSKRVIVALAENAFRDTAYGHEVPTGACLGAATRGDAESGLNDLGAKFLGVNAYEFQDIDKTPQEQMEAIATDTHSYIDADGDGAEDDLAVLHDSGGWDWPKTNMIVDAIFDLAD